MKAILIKLFVAQRKLERVIADLPELLAQPAAVLARKEICIGPMNMYPALLAAILLGLVAPILHIHSWNLRVAQIGLAAGVALAILTWFFFPRGKIRLTADGVVFQNGQSEVRCPWELFNTPGHPLPRDRWQLLLPVSSAAVSYVELRQEGYFRAQGAAVKTRFFRFRGDDSLWLRFCYEAYPADVGELLLRLGRMLGTRSLSRWTPPEAHRAQEASSGSVGIVGPDGTVMLSVTRLFFPPSCCACGQTTNQWKGFRVSVRWGVLLALLGGGHIHPPLVDIPIPMCTACQERLRRNGRLGCWLGVIAGLFLLATQAGLVIVAGDKLNQARGVWMAMVVIFMLALFFGSLSSWLIGMILAGWRCSPLRSARYSVREGTVHLRFHRAKYAKQVAEYAQATGKRNEE